jgi:hypothetical protein
MCAPACTVSADKPRRFRRETFIEPAHRVFVARYTGECPDFPHARQLRHRGVGGHEAPLLPCPPHPIPRRRNLLARPILAIVLLGVSAGAAGQQVVKVPQSEARVSRPDDLFELTPGQWHFARHLWEGQEPCTPTECEGGYTTGDLVISTEHAGRYVRIIAGFRGCESVGYSEVEVGKSPGTSSFRRVRRQVPRVVRGVAKTCKLTAPDIATLDAAQLFPAEAGS